MTYSHGFFGLILDHARSPEELVWENALLRKQLEVVCRQVRHPRLRHGHQIWACDFPQVYDLFFRPLFAFFVIALGSRRVVHSGVTRSPSSAWVTQQLREATAWGEGPRFLICDDDKFGGRFAAAAAATGIRTLRTPVRAPNANAVCERFLRSVRAECLDHVIILDDGQRNAPNPSKSPRKITPQPTRPRLI